MRLIARLAWRNLRARPGQAVLLLLALSVSTTTLSLALAINETGNGAWDRLHRATNGHHIRTSLAYQESLLPPQVQSHPPTPADVARAHDRLAALAAEPEVVAASGPWPILFTDGEIGGVHLELFVMVREAAPAAVGQPLVTSGRWLSDSGDGVVLEDGVAAILRDRPGDTITIAGRRLPVVGSATTVSFGRYPLHQPARVWVNAPTASALRAAGAVDFAAELELRLAHQESAAAFVAAHGSGPRLVTWQQTRVGVHETLTTFAIAFLIIATLLAWLTIATAAVLVAGRMAAQSHQVGTLKAVGVTPGQVTGVLLVEYLMLAGTAAVVGVVAGTLLSPLLAPAAVLYGPPQAPPITWTRAVVAFAVAAAVVVLATIRPALRGVRLSTVRALAATIRPPRRPSRLARLAGLAGLPLPAVLGVRTAMRRPGRTLGGAVGLALGIAMVVVGLGLYRGTRAYLATPILGEAESVDRRASESLIDLLLNIVFGSAAVLVALAVVNAFVLAVFAARDNARHHAILRTLGATPRQTVTAFVVAQLSACLLACLLGIPFGVLLYNTFVAGDDLGPIRLPALVYAVIATASLTLYAVAVTAPARLLATRPITPLLTYE